MELTIAQKTQVISVLKGLAKIDAFKVAEAVNIRYHRTGREKIDHHDVALYLDELARSSGIIRELPRTTPYTTYTLNTQE